MATTFYTSKDLAARFNVSDQTLRNWERDGKIPAAGRTPGGHRRYTDEHIARIEAMLKNLRD